MKHAQLPVHLPVRARLLLAALLGVLLPSGLLATAPATATEEPPGGEILVIMDVSGSMERQDASGTTLIEGARDAIGRLVDSAPAETSVGLRLYGSEYAGNDEAVGCRDTELAVPIGPLSQNGQDIRQAIEQARPTGFTPIGYSLQQAADDFSPEGERSIVLVSDGEDTCGDPAPCEAARDLARQDIDVRVDTVGLFLQDDPAARRQLQCIADATGGRFHRADDAAALGRQLTAVSTRAIQSFEASGTEIDGGPAATEAAPIEPGQAYSDDVGFGEARWYSFEAQAGDRITVTLTEPGTTEYGCCLILRLQDPDLEQVDFENDFNSSAVAETYRVATDEEGAELSGTHYVQVSLEADGKGLVDYQLTVESQPGAAPTEETAPTEEPSPSETSASESPAAQPDAEPAAAESDGGDGLLWTIIVVLVLLVLGLAGAVAVLFRRLSGGASGGPGIGGPGA